MGYIKAEIGKNGKFELEIEIKACSSIECLSFASGVAVKILNSIAKGEAKTLKGKAKTFAGYKRALIRAIEMAEFNNHE